MCVGLAQCSELCWQLRGLADKRQVRGAKLALQHNIGLGGAAVVALYKLGFPHAHAKKSLNNSNHPYPSQLPPGYKMFTLGETRETFPLGCWSKDSAEETREAQEPVDLIKIEL
uniref:Uncharacterized protein n=1 Tax=Timema poppense TaxID=170557 RepID=A0A7R9DN11_TIMPO|nr:unnamed protein product [Timema poppensis]